MRRYGSRYNNNDDYERVELRRCPATDKPCYDKRGAVTAANRRRHEDRVRLRVYPCPDCGAWHLTSDV